jgi:hypothetical protein
VNPGDLPNPLPPNPSEPKTPGKVLAFRIGLGFSVLGILLLETGLPGIIVLVVGIISLVTSGFFDRFNKGQ